ncbi:Ig-like domain-containing protein [Cesiribacter andamanensis]|uniref:Lipoprotein n=1 Tax=Cesiribacter andamanensis AMV16 TaxID=1279009 RepID=M7N7L6_9BACT|nr:Ig-like domain-containing protein [Cesiribacter andamanensis]EMR04598.1 hypothetical protein ADICEAN_00200 [Cesiribacter andamanensis AMV16]
MKRPLFFLLLLLGPGFYSCDQLAEDVVPQRELLANGSRSIWASGHGPSVFTLESLYSSTSPFSLQITAAPRRGELQINPHGFLLYKPDPDFRSGRDRMGYMVLQNGQVLASDTLYIQMLTESSQPPCQTGAFSDSLEIVPNCIDQRLDVLTNDLYCQGAAPAISIAVAPAHGAIRQEGDQLYYTPARGYKGSDYFIYQFCQQSGTGAPPACSYAYVQLQIAESSAESCSIEFKPEMFIRSANTEIITKRIALDRLDKDRSCTGSPSMETSINHQSMRVST